MADPMAEFMNGASKSSLKEDKERHAAQQNNIIVEDMAMNNFYIDVELDKIIDKLISNSEQIEHIIPRMVLDSFVKNINVHHTRNKKLLIKMWKSN